MQAEGILVLQENAELLEKVIYDVHGVIGQAMLKSWKFPDDLVDIPILHEQLRRTHDGSADYVDIVVVSNIQSYQNTHHQYASIEWETVPAFAKLGLDSSVSETDAEESRNSIDSMLDALLV